FGTIDVQNSNFNTHELASEYQPEKPIIRVLLPDHYESSKSYRVLYVLPVEAGTGERWGDPIGEVRRHDLHNKYQLICVFPTFAQLPWYADHPTDISIRQESFLLTIVLPFIEKTYATTNKRQDRLLVGFSKSGWGAFSLLLRHPDVFERAAAWDAPLMMDAPGQYGSGPIFGTDGNFQKYQVSALLKKQAKLFDDKHRLISLGYDNFREHHLQIHALMSELKIAHIHRDGPQRKHHWNSGWLPEAVELLVKPN
ncbi:MAG TPA: alpha/beta hydrolase-fold protein, partial [Planctomycetaceae bacterium]|nr:alpha/beta hydrolase-fold protein [Planctomycetaceae bacterium]